MARVSSDEDSNGGGVDGDEADKDVRQEEADQHEQPRDWVVCKHHLLHMVSFNLRRTPGRFL